MGIVFVNEGNAVDQKKTNDARTIWTNDMDERLGSFREINYRTNELYFTKQTILLKERFY